MVWASAIIAKFLLGGDSMKKSKGGGKGLPAGNKSGGGIKSFETNTPKPKPNKAK